MNNQQSNFISLEGLHDLEKEQDGKNERKKNASNHTYDILK